MRLRIYPDPILKRRGVPVPGPRSAEVVERELKPRLEQMFEIMDREGGIGLAAPQVGWSVRIFVTCIPVGEAQGDRRVYINPEIIEAEGAEEAEEGCLSFPDIRGRVTRHSEVRMRAEDLQGNVFEEVGTGLTARCWEHEIDHLDGILFISRMTPGDRLAIASALRELEEEYRRRNARRSSRK